MPKDLYATLGVPKSATAEELRKSFRKLAKESHPDRHPNDKAAEDKFKTLSAAFDILGDPEKRKRYDRGEIDADGRETSRGFGGGGPFGGEAPFRRSSGGRAGTGFEGADLEDILNDLFRGRGPGGGAGQGRGPARGEDLRLKLSLDLEEAILGGPKRVVLPSGDALDLTLPKGAKEGQVLRLRGKGQPSRQGGPQGDALVELAIKPHPLYRVEGADLHMDLPITAPDAILGAKIDAPTPEGVVNLTVPAKANSGQTLRLKGRGGVDEQGRRGDLFAHLVITLPDPPDEALIKFAQEWRDKRPYVAKKRS